MESGTINKAVLEVEVMLKEMPLLLNVPNIMRTIEEAITLEYGAFDSHVRVTLKYTHEKG